MYLQTSCSQSTRPSVKLHQSISSVLLESFSSLSSNIISTAICMAVFFVVNLLSFCHLSYHFLARHSYGIRVAHTTSMRKMPPADCSEIVDFVEKLLFCVASVRWPVAPALSEFLAVTSCHKMRVGSGQSPNLTPASRQSLSTSGQQ